LVGVAALALTMGTISCIRIVEAIMPKKRGPKFVYGKEMKKRLIVVLSGDHAKRIAAAAQKAETSQSAWARKILLENAPEVEKKENE
jgi:hypothetical protein